jgi:tetratricopeptide (TPR) repeat protein
MCRIKKPRVALKFLKAALQLEKKDSLVPPPDIASTYLNLCAIYSELGHHSEAINKAVKSILLIKDFLLTRLQQNNTD